MNQMSIKELPLIRIYEYDGHLWSIDNRRLWIMRECVVHFITKGHIRKNIVRVDLWKFNQHFFSLHG